MTDQQFLALLGASPFLILSVTWAIGDYIVNQHPRPNRRGLGGHIQAGTTAHAVFYMFRRTLSQRFETCP